MVYKYPDCDRLCSDGWITAGPCFDDLNLRRALISSGLFCEHPDAVYEGDIYFEQLNWKETWSVHSLY